MEDLQPTVVPVHFKSSVGLTRVFDITFYPQDLLNALVTSYANDYPKTVKGQEFLKKVIPDLQRWLKDKKQLNAPDESLQSQFLNILANQVFKKIRYRLDEKIVNRLLSIITEGQIAAERSVQDRHHLPFQNIDEALDDIYYNNYELSRDVLDIRDGRRSGTRNKPKTPAEQESIKTDRELEILRSMLQLLSKNSEHSLTKQAVGRHMKSGRSKIYDWIKTGIDYKLLQETAWQMNRKKVPVEDLKGAKGRELFSVYKKNMT